MFSFCLWSKRTKSIIVDEAWEKQRDASGHAVYTARKNNEKKMESIYNFSKRLLSVSLPQVKINLLNVSQPCQKSSSDRGQVFLPINLWVTYYIQTM